MIELLNIPEIDCYDHIEMIYNIGKKPYSEEIMETSGEETNVLGKTEREKERTDSSSSGSEHDVYVPRFLATAMNNDDKVKKEQEVPKPVKEKETQNAIIFEEENSENLDKKETVKSQDTKRSEDVEQEEFKNILRQDQEITDSTQGTTEIPEVDNGSTAVTTEDEMESNDNVVRDSVKSRNISTEIEADQDKTGSGVCTTDSAKDPENMVSYTVFKSFCIRTRN